MAQRNIEVSHLIDSVFSVMVRDVNGNIRHWNKAAERQYGWSRKQAVGNVSHVLLDTVFPVPLEQINEELLENGYWEGPLIHTLSNGARVKVLSRWTLQQEEGGKSSPSVVEINADAKSIVPESAHLITDPNFVSRMIRFFAQHWKWWVIPLVGGIVVFGFLVEVSLEHPIVPLGR